MEYREMGVNYQQFVLYSKQALSFVLIFTLTLQLYFENSYAQIPQNPEGKGISGELPPTDTLPTPTPLPQSEDECISKPIYRIHGDTTRLDKTKNGKTPLFTGVIPSCLLEIAASCGGYDGTIQTINEFCGGGLCTTRRRAIAAFSDDCMIGFLLLGRAYNPGNTWWTRLVDPRNTIPPGITIDSSYCNPRLSSCYWFSFTTHLDSNCNKVINPEYSCSDGYARAIVSPISLEWIPGAAAKQTETIVNFPLIPSSPQLWHSWRASAEMPLLVYDPEHKGIISDGTQLFGAYTFGRSWKNGYEPLATLDKNGDQKLTSSELSNLALWFDINRNGLSELGEVLSLADVGVLSLNVGPVEDLGGDNDIVLNQGFEYLNEDEILTGRSIDWFSKTYISKAHAAMDLQGKFVRTSERTEAEETIIAELEKRTSGQLRKWNGESLAGSWQWRLLDEQKNIIGHDSQPVGILRLRDLGYAEVDGYSLIELGQKKASQHTVKGYFLIGEKFRDGDGAVGLNFKVVSSDGQVTISKATLSPDGKKLLGESSLDIPVENKKSETIKYNWIAEKIL